MSKNNNDNIHDNHRPNKISNESQFISNSKSKSKSKMLSPSNRLLPNSSKSQSLSILSCTSKNSKMSPIDINELGSDEKDDIQNKK